MDLQTLLVWLTTTGAGLVAWWIVDRIIWKYQTSDEIKRYVALAISGAIALAAWDMEIAMLYQPAPADWRAWVEQGVSILFTAFGVSQLAHARAKAARAAKARRMTPRG
jgi:hypothetical protein